MIITPPRFEWLFSMLDLDAAYDNTRAVAESSELLRSFEARSDVLASRFSGTMDVPYGKGAREKFDFFPGNPGAGIFVFVHGGYWQMRHKNTFRFLAKGPLSLGMHVASVGYTLAPEASLSEIVQEVRNAIHKICEFAKAFLADTEKVVVSGWSAGGHLATLMLDEPSVKSALAISGIYDLEPISKCYLNQALNLSPEEILNLSPMRISSVSKPMAIVVGAEELPELRRQSLEFATRRASEKIPVTFGLLEGCNHFTILHELENPSGVLCRMLASLLK